eukprot:7354918-Pyramimonas_sp.AAC.1
MSSTLPLWNGSTARWGGRQTARGSCASTFSRVSQGASGSRCCLRWFSLRGLVELNKGLVVLSRGLVGFRYAEEPLVQDVACDVGFRYAEEPLVQDVACDVRSVQLTTRRMLRYMADVKMLSSMADVRAHGGC